MAAIGHTPTDGGGIHVCVENGEVMLDCEDIAGESTHSECLNKEQATKLVSVLTTALDLIREND